jgi:hypothetical protein
MTAVVVASMSRRTSTRVLEGMHSNATTKPIEQHSRPLRDKAGARTLYKEQGI